MLSSENGQCCRKLDFTKPVSSSALIKARWYAVLTFCENVSFRLGLSSSKSSIWARCSRIVRHQLLLCRYGWNCHLSRCSNSTIKRFWSCRCSATAHACEFLKKMCCVKFFPISWGEHLLLRLQPTQVIVFVQVLVRHFVFHWWRDLLSNPAHGPETVLALDELPIPENQATNPSILNHPRFSARAL